MPNYKKYLFIALSLSSLTACDAMDDNAGRVGNDVHNWYDNSRYRLSTYIYDQNRRQPELPPPGSPRYCYRVQTDIMCYTQPQPNAASRFVAGQDEQGYIESVTVEDPSAYAVMGNATATTTTTTYDSYSSNSSHTGLGGAYSGPPGVAPPLETVQVGDAPAVSGINGEKPFYYVQSPSAVDSMSNIRASYDTSKANGPKETPTASTAKDAKLSEEEKNKSPSTSTGSSATTTTTVQSSATIPPSLLEDTTVSSMTGNKPAALMSRN